MSELTDVRRFWSHVNQTDDCWEWLGAKGGLMKYGEFHLNGKIVPAHRYSWELHYGSIPKGMYVLHTCDNPPCVNPAHLFLGTPQDNMDDMVAKGRENRERKLTKSQVLEIRERASRNDATQEQLAQEFGITQAMISGISTGRYWKHV